MQISPFFSFARVALNVPQKRFLSVLIKTIESLLGTKAMKNILIAPPWGDFVVSFLGKEVEFKEGCSQEIAKQLAARLAAYLQNGFGKEFTENLFLRSYQAIQQAKMQNRELSQVLTLVPEGFLENEKIKFLSKEELENQVIGRTKDLQELNDTLEKRVIDRTLELAHANQELQSKNQRLVELSKAKTDFVSFVAHQMLNPLSLIKMGLAEMQSPTKDKNKKQAKELLENMQKTNERSIRLIENLLNVARIEEGRFAYNFQNVDLQGLLKETIQNLKLKAEEKKIAISFSSPQNVPLIKADREKLYLVFENLIANAIIYTTSEKNIDVRLFEKDHALIVEIQDYGIGIPIEDQGKIFQKFFRAQNAVDQIQGNGLGLFIVKQIIESHGGTIAFKSEEGKGTTFFVDFPVPTIQ